MISRAQLQSKAAPQPAAPLLQRKCACGGSAGPIGECSDCRQKGILRRSGEKQAGPSTAPPIVHEVLGSPGQSLDSATRGFMESRFGHDFSRVRIHTDSQADKSAQSVNALAYTVGSDVVFRSGEYAPQTRTGRHLLAHELTHVIQQSSDAPLPEVLNIGGTTDPSETRARQCALAVTSGWGTPQEAAGRGAETGLIRRFEASERDQITNLDAAMETARTIAEETGIAYMMRWGRFTAGAGGVGAIEKLSPSVGSTADSLANRYVFTCRCGLIDLRHFYELMYIALLFGNASATQEGRAHEQTAEATSQFAPEDTPSNALGAFFGDQQSYAELQSTFVEDLRNFLGLCSPVDFLAVSQSDQDAIVTYYSDRTPQGIPANQNETATPAVLSVSACGNVPRTFPFVIDPADPQHNTIVGFAAQPGASAMSSDVLKDVWEEGRERFATPVHTKVATGRAK